MTFGAHSRNRTEDLLIFKGKFPTSETQYHYAKRASLNFGITICVYDSISRRDEHELVAPRNYVLPKTRSTKYSGTYHTI